MHHPRLLPWLGLFIIACSGGGQSNTQTESEALTEESAETAEGTAPSPSPATRSIPLAGAYATSTALPHAQHNLSRMFDGDPTTAWASMPGAGPDEGIMLYFEEPVDFDGLALELSPESAHLMQCEVYVNGQPQSKPLRDQKLMVEGSGARAVYLRFTFFDELTTVSTEKEGNYILANLFPEDQQVQITELSLLQGGERVRLTAPRGVSGSVSASSILPPATAYGPRNLFDGRKEFAWVEGAPENGPGETLTFTFDQAQTLRGLEIANGFQRSDRHFASNARLKTATLSNGTDRRTLTLRDAPGTQAVTFEPLRGQQMTLTLGEAYPGSQYKDLVISELTFLTEAGPATLLTARAGQVKKDLLARAQGTALEKYLDRRIDNVLDEMEGTRQSIVLRSDYTFVIYENGGTTYADGSEESHERLADGSWEWKEGDGDAVRIRIFGKLLELSKIREYYGDNSQESYERIFQDYLTVSPEKITGERFFETFWYVSPEDQL